MSQISYQEAKMKVLSGDFSVEDYLRQNDFTLEYAYCRLLKGDSEGARKAFRKISSTDFRADWGRKLIQFIQGYVTDVPTYFQIRNFLEIDLNMLIHSGQAQFVENIINGADLFYSMNPESYKFIARVMYNNDYTELALLFLNKAKEKFYHDPEMHYMLANCFIRKGDKIQARNSVQNCLSILPEYFPAKKLLERIDN